VNTDAPWPSLDEARSRVLKIQTKLHRWATDGPDRRFDDLFSLVCDPAFLTVGWDRVRGNQGARTAGVDGVKPRSIGKDQRLTSGACGEPDALEGARPVRGAGRGNGLAETPAPRPGSTPLTGCCACPALRLAMSASVLRG